MAEETSGSLTSTSKPVVDPGDGAHLPAIDKHRYTLDRELGRGAQSIVCLALDSSVGREVAFKMVRAAGGNGAFVREARITGQLEHPGIVPVYEIGHDDRGQMYCTQKLVRGRSLRAALDACAGETDRLALLPHLIDVCNAVAYAHSRGVVHRDLKPDNVMVGEFGETVVLDWGIAKVLGSVDAQPVARPLEGLTPQQTMQGAVMGTPLYLSPEQAAGDIAAIDRRSDVWSLGVMLYELVAGQLPFEASSLETLLEKVKAGKYLALPDALPGVSPELAAIVTHALQRRPDDRFRDASAMARELAAFRAGGRLSVYAYSSWELLKRFVARNKALTAVVTAAVVAIAGAGAAAWANYRRAEANRQESQGRLAAQFLAQAQLAQTRLDWTSALALFQSAQLADPSEEARWGLAFVAPLASPAHARQHLKTTFQAAAFDRRGGFAVCGPVGIRVYAADGAPRGDFPRLPYCDVRLSDEGTWLATTGNRVTLLYDVKSGAQVPLEGGPHGYTFTFGPGHGPLAVGLWTGAVEIFDPETGKKTGTLPATVDEPVYMVRFSPNGRQLAVGSRNGQIAVWDLATMERTLRFHARAFPSVALFDGDRLIVGDHDRFVEVLDLAGTHRVQTLAEHTRGIEGLELSPDGHLLATASDDGSIVVWESQSLRPMARVLAKADVGAIAFVPDGSALDAITLDGQLLRWNLTRLPKLFASGPKATYGNAVAALAFSPDAGNLAWLHGALGVGTLRLADGKVAQRGLTAGSSLAWGARGLAVGTPRGVDLIDPVTLHPAASFDAHGTPTLGLTWSPDGQTLWVAGGGTVDAWDADGGEQTGSFDAGMLAQFVAASPDGQRLAWAGSADAVVLRDVGSGRTIATASGLARPVRGLAFSPDGKLVAAGSADGTVTVLDGRTGAEVCRGFGHTSTVFAVAFGPGGTHVASASLDRTVRVWATADCRQVGTVPPIHGEAVALAWSSNGRTLAIADTYGVVHVLDVGL